MNKKWVRIITGIIVSNLAGLLMVEVSIKCSEKFHYGTLVASVFVIIPIAMGMISAFFWRDTLSKSREYVRFSILNTVVALGLASIYLMEGIVCLVIVSPILVGFMLTGTLLTRSLLFRKPKSGAYLMPVALFLLVADSMSPPVYQDYVEDQVVINAPVEIVWKYVPAFPEITRKDQHWLFPFGLPQPQEVQVEGVFKGAWRRCIFSGGLVFEEVISGLILEKEITFEVTKQPFDPEVFNHVTIEKGKMSLKDNGDGTTTLTGITWYQLHAFPAWYYRAWADSIGRGVHYQVMEHIKQLSEQHNEAA